MKGIRAGIGEPCLLYGKQEKNNVKQNIPHKPSRKKGLSVMSGVATFMFTIEIRISTHRFPPN